MKKTIFSMFLIVLVCSCAYQNPNVKNIRDQAKLEYNLLVQSYFTVYQAVSDFLNNPYVDQEKKDYVKRYITPKLNQFKKQLIDLSSLFIDQATTDWELLRQVRLLKQNLDALIVNLQQIGLPLKGANYGEKQG